MVSLFCSVYEIVFLNQYIAPYFAIENLFKMADSFNHCVKVSCSMVDLLQNPWKPGTYFICNKNQSKTVEETFCSIPDLASYSWFNEGELETFLYDVAENSSATSDDKCLKMNEMYFSCSNNTNCCFSNHTKNFLQERSCSEYSNCSSFLIKEFTRDEEELGRFLSKFFIGFFLILGLMAVLGNLAVIVHSFKVLYRNKSKSATEKQIYHVLILNLSFADFAMGIYVLVLILSSILYISNYSYGDYTIKNEGTTLCLVVGFINFAASQISVTAIATITGLRLFSVLYPYKSVRLRVIIQIVAFTWIFWISVAFIPASTNDALRSVFADEIRISFENRHQVTIRYQHLKFLLEQIFKSINVRCGFPSEQNLKFAKRPTWNALLYVSKQLDLVNSDVEDRVNYLGYYNGQWVCTMKFFQSYRNLSSYFTIPVVLFNVFGFSFIMIAQFVIAWKTSTCCHYRKNLRCNFCAKTKKRKTRERALSEQQKREQENRKMYRRMFFIVVTDFCCWIPLSLLTLDYYARSLETNKCKFLEYKRYFELWLPAFIMLVVPINSSINPFIYSFRFWSPFLKKICCLNRFCKKTSKEQSSTTSLQTSDSIHLETASSKVTLNLSSTSVGQYTTNSNSAASNIIC